MIANHLPDDIVMAAVPRSKPQASRNLIARSSPQQSVNTRARPAGVAIASRDSAAKRKREITGATSQQENSPSPVNRGNTNDDVEGQTSESYRTGRRHRADRVVGAARITASLARVLVVGEFLHFRGSFTRSA
jgi:hypothetical protein